MDSMKSISTGNSLIKTCTCVLDAIYSSYDCIEFLSTLQRIETNLYLNYYETVESLKEDIQEKIPQISNAFINSVQTNDNNIPEEYAVTPIYSSVRFKKESKMYAVNIKTHHELHSSIFNAIENPVDCLHRLHIINKSIIEEIRDSINSILCLFFNVEIQPDINDSNLYCIKAKVATVHVLGDFHPVELTDFDGWIKVKIAHTNTINTRLPAKLARRLFEKQDQTPRKIMLKISTDKESALYNELVRQFMYNVLPSHLESFKDFNSHSIANNTKEIIKNTQSKANSDLESPAPSLITLPNLYQSASKVLNLITTTTTANHNTNHNNQNSEASKNDGIITPSEPIFVNFWRKLEKLCYENDAKMVHKNEYKYDLKQTVNASGFFKRVYFTKDNNVLQIFERSTASQRMIEIASLLALKDQPCIGRIKEVIYDDNEVIGLTMDRYEMTLKQYLHKHTHHRLNAEERMHIVVQMLESISISHQAGIAHRDLSTVNFMINSDAKLYLIDYGKAVFLNARDAKRWWVEYDDSIHYQEDVKAATREELAVWCRNLPYVMAKPDHGYRFYRSIQTLPRTEKDRTILPHLIDPAAEDIYSLGTMIWKIFSGLEPWPGVFDFELKKFRELVSSDFSIDRMLDQSMPGPISKMFLQMFLRVEPKNRRSATDILYWIKQDDIKNALIEEWSAINGSRRTAARNNIHCKPAIPERTETAAAKLQVPSEVTKANDNEPKKRGRPFKYPRPENQIEITKKRPGRPRKSVEPPMKNASSIEVVQSPLKHHTYVIDADGIRRFAKSGIIVGRRPNAANSDQVNHVAKVVKKRGRPPTVHIKEEYTESTSLRKLTNAIAPSTKNSNIYYKYVPSGKPRGRPRKQPRGFARKESNDEVQTDTTAPNTNRVIKGMKTSQESLDSPSSKTDLNTNNDVSENQTTVYQATTNDAGSSINTNIANKVSPNNNPATTPSSTKKSEINSSNSTTNSYKTPSNSHHSSPSDNITDNTTLHKSHKRSVDDSLNDDNKKRRSSVTIENVSSPTTVVENVSLLEVSNQSKKHSKHQHVKPNVASSSNSETRYTNDATTTTSKSDVSNATSSDRRRYSREDRNDTNAAVTSKREIKEPLPLIRPPSQPKKVLDKETIELVNRSSSVNIRDQIRSSRFVSSPKPSASIVRNYMKQSLSPPSPQSPALSPVSNTETVEDITSPLSPVPSKRKYECQIELNSKRQNTGENLNDPEITVDKFDVALFTILRNINANNNVH